MLNLTTIAAQIQQALRELRSLNKVIKDCIILLLLGHLLTEASSIMEHLCPAINNRQVYWFLCPQYHMKMEIKWYVKYATDDLLWIIVFYCFAKISALYSTYLFLVAVIFFVYHLIDAFFFWWNFKTSHYIYWDLLLSVIFFMKNLFKPYKPETICKMKSLF